jgi:hypothetical protein
MGMIENFFIENSKKDESNPETKKRCPTHNLTGQTFSIMEMEQLVRNFELYGICKNCKHWFETQLQERVRNDTGGNVGRISREKGK